MNGLLGLPTGFARMIQSTQKPTDPAFVQLRDFTQKKNRSLQVLTLACTINSVAFIMFGFVGMVSTPLFLLALPLGYFAYNMYKISLNAEDIIENVKKYRAAQKPVNNLYKVEEKVVRELLIKDTFHFEPFVGVIVGEFVRPREAMA